MKKSNILIVLPLVVLLLASCNTEKEYLVTIKTEYGDMHAILYDQTPEHKKNFVKLAQEGFYDSLLFHRVMKNFMIQGGDPNSKNAKPNQPLGSGGPGHTVPAEFKADLFHKKGALSAARQPDRVNPEKKSSGSQFYLVQGKVLTEEEVTTDMEKLNSAIGTLLMRTDFQEDRNELANLYNNQQFDAYEKKIISLRKAVEDTLQIDVSKKVSAERIKAYTSVGGAPHLDDEYTVFGQVIDGIEIIDQIAEQPVDNRNRPKEDQRFFISIEELSKKKIEKLYDYEFPQTEKK